MSDTQLRRLAWFSPMPPVRTGVAACSADVLRVLGCDDDIDVFVDTSARATVDEPSVAERIAVRSAHEFVWRHRQAPYELIVYQLGNSAHHEYIWPYLFRFPGLAVLHDARLHHARAAALLRERRADDYRAEFAANHPDSSPDLAELAIKGHDNHLYYASPMTRLVVRASRLTAVHSRVVADELRAENPDAAVETIRLGHGNPAVDRAAAANVRARYGIAADAVLFVCAGGLSPEKRIPQVLDAFASVRAHVPAMHLLLAGAPPAHYDLHADIARLGLQSSATVTGYLDADAELDACIAAADVALTLRWPTAREVSGPWLRCLAAGTPTVIVHLAHLAHVPSLDPRNWQPTAPPGSADSPGPVSVAIDILDEIHSLRLAMRRLATDPALRASLGDAGRRYWQAHHSIDAMVSDYRRLLRDAAGRPAPAAALPQHLINDGDRRLSRLLEPFGVASGLE